MTRKLYYEDSYLRELNLEIVEVRNTNSRTEVALESTIFYPTGGGQPYDTGEIAGRRVVDVYEEDNTVWHVISGAPELGNVKCRLDWERRFDHMQQHAGQHILSAACEKLLGANTIGFHLGEEYTTIDLDIENISWEQVEKIEREANRIVFSNLAIKAYWMAPEEAGNLPLRKLPQVKGRVRIVEIDSYDFSPCGGTHPHYTGEIGLIKILRTERVRKNVRLVFVCGERALRNFQLKTRSINYLTDLLSVPENEIPEAAQRAVDEVKESHKELRRMGEQLLEYTAEKLYREAVDQTGICLVSRIFDDYDADQVRILAAKLTANPQTVALLASRSDKTHFVFSRSRDLQELHMGQILKRALALVNGRGGGRPENAQGGTSQTENIEKALIFAEREVYKALGKEKL